MLSCMLRVVVQTFMCGKSVFVELALGVLRRVCGRQHLNAHRRNSKWCSLKNLKDVDMCAIR